MAFCGQQLFQDARGISDFDRVLDCFFRDADTPFAKSLQHVRFGNAVQAFELNVANDRQFFDVESNDNAAARAIFDRDSGFGLVEKSQREDGLQVAFDLGRIVGIAGASLNVIDDVVFAQTAITENLNILNQTRLRLLCAGPIRQKNRRHADNDGQNGQPNDAIRVHK